MKNDYRPLYLVVTTSKETLTNLQKEVRYIMHTKITWERHINKKELTQCHQYQLWGHATSNCGRALRCLKCAEQHETRQRTKSKDLPAKCANCGGVHPANSVNCPVYLFKMRMKQERSQPKQKTASRYVLAPIPNVKSWMQAANLH